MAERKTKRNARTSKAPDGFRMSKEPVVRLTRDSRSSDVGDNIGLPRIYGPPILFAIARDPSTVFVSWNIDWPSVFEKAIPEDRQVHLRLLAADGLVESRVAVEPMATIHFITTSGLHGSYRVEIGYYRPADFWHPVAVSNEITMPPSAIAEIADVDLATIPLHISFQQLLEVFGAADQTALAKKIAQFQQRALNSEGLSPKERKFLRRLGVSPSEIAGARRAFDETDTEKLARRTRAFLASAATSPSRGFDESSWGS
jgi:hypothetical protein